MAVIYLTRCLAIFSHKSKTVVLVLKWSHGVFPLVYPPSLFCRALKMAGLFTKEIYILKATAWCGMEIEPFSLSTLFTTRV